MATVNTQKDAMVDSDRDIQITRGGDILLTRTQEEYLNNFLAIAVGDAVRDLLGSPQSENALQALRSELWEALSENPQIDTVRYITIESIDTRQNTVEVEIVLVNNTSFTIEL